MQRLDAFLRALRVGQGEECTHTSLAGGKFYVRAGDRDAFWDAYVAAVDAGATPALVERHRHVGPFVVDLDFRQESPRRLYSDAHVDAFVRRLVVLPDVRRERPVGNWAGSDADFARLVKAYYATDADVRYVAKTNVTENKGRYRAVYHVLRGVVEAHIDADVEL
jgi:hypothetical protein